MLQVYHLRELINKIQIFKLLCFKNYYVLKYRDLSDTISYNIVRYINKHTHQNEFIFWKYPGQTKQDFLHFHLLLFVSYDFFPIYDI